MRWRSRRVADLQSALKTIEAGTQAIDDGLLAGAGLFAVGNVTTDTDGGKLQAVQAPFDLGHILGDLVDASAQVTQMF